MGSRGAALVCAALTVLVALSGVMARSTYGAQTSSDEPQYLLTALSLANDADLDISDEIAGREFEPFHEIDLNPQTFELNDSGQQLSPHDPLLPLLTAPAMGLAGWVGVRLTLVAVAGLVAGLTCWTAMVRFGVGRRSALVVVSAVCCGAPVAAYSTQVFPEIMAAAAVIAVVAAASGDRVGRGGWCVVVGGLIALPWLSVKYTPVAAALALVIAVGSINRGRHRELLVPGVVLVGAGVIYLLVHQRIYGGWTVYSTGDHFVSDGEFAVIGTDPDYLGRSRRLVGLLVDRRFGLIPWAPVWALAPAAVSWMLARRHPQQALVLVPAAAGWLVATFVALTMHGWWSPGRQLVVVVPLLALALTVMVDELPALVVPVAVAGLVGASNWIWLAVEASTDRRALIVDFYETAAPGYRLVESLFARGWPASPDADTILALWAAILGASMVAAWRRVRASSGGSRDELAVPDPLAGQAVGQGSGR